LAVIGILLGATGTLYAVASGLPLLETEDQFLAVFREVVEHQPLPPEMTREQQAAVAEREAQVVYRRRGLTLPLDVMGALLSGLLFLGCVRARRGDAWGASAWSFAALLSIPYQSLDTVAAMVQAHDLRSILVETGSAPAADALKLETQRNFLLLVKLALEIAYYAASILVLRRARVRAWFSATA
jgi:hypothetical protein